jgi:hypothetical protein
VTLIAATLAPDRAWLSSDTMLFDDDGQPAFEAFKLLVLPGARAVAAVTGPLDFGIALYHGLQADKPTSLEEALACAQTRLVELSRAIPDEPVELVIVGWSALHGRAEGWVLSLFERTTIEPLLVQAGESYFKPFPVLSSQDAQVEFDALLAGAAEGRQVPAFHLSCARVIAHQPGDFAGGTLWTAEISAVGAALHRTGELPC